MIRFLTWRFWYVFQIVISLMSLWLAFAYQVPWCHDSFQKKKYFTHIRDVPLHVENLLTSHAMNAAPHMLVTSIFWSLEIVDLWWFVSLKSTLKVTNSCACVISPWASNQIRNIAGCACARIAGNVFPRRRLQRKPLISDPGMHHGTCVTHVPWCMLASLASGGGENVPGIPGTCAPAIFRVWQDAHGPSCQRS